MPRVDNGYPRRLEIAHIPSHDRHAMDERRGGNEGIAIRARIWYVEGRVSLGYDSVNRQDSPVE